VVTGDPATEVERIAAQTGADAIVMGVTHRGAFSRKLFGGTATRLMRIAERPVVAVPQFAAPVPGRAQSDPVAVAA
jgi:nucleotide-binding universal stress UspA family protein